MLVTPTATLDPTATPLAVLVSGYGADAISVGDVAVVAVLMFGFGILAVVFVLLLLRRAI